MPITAATSGDRSRRYRCHGICQSAGRMNFRLDPGHWSVDGGELISERTHTRFEGEADWDARGRFAFHVTSGDFQEADQLLAGIITDFGSPTGTVAFGGRGTFDGTMSGPFRRPRVEGTFSGEDLWAWDTLWGDGSARVIIENNYIDVRDGVVRLRIRRFTPTAGSRSGYRDDAATKSTRGSAS